MSVQSNKMHRLWNVDIVYLCEESSQIMILIGILLHCIIINSKNILGSKDNILINHVTFVIDIKYNSLKKKAIHVKAI